MNRFCRFISVIFFSAAAVAQSTIQVDQTTGNITLSGAQPTTSANAPTPLVVSPVAGGNSSSGTAGTGSSPSITAGPGGNGTGSGPAGGGNGGGVTVTAGNGGSSVGSANNAAGGSITISTGAGGSLGGGTSANGGSVLITTGAGGAGGSGNNGNGGDVVISTGLAGGANGRGGALIVNGFNGNGGTVGSPAICTTPTTGICLYWTGASQNVLAWRDCTGGNCPNSGNQVSAGMDDQGTRYSIQGAVRFLNGSSLTTSAIDACLVDDGTGQNTLAIMKPDPLGGNCGAPHPNEHTGHLSLTNLNAYGNITLNGSTSGSSVLSVTPTGGTLNLGSTNATVDSSGDYSGLSATFTTPAESTTTPLSISQGSTSTGFPAAALSITQGANTGTTNVPALNIAATWNDSSHILPGPVFNLSLTNTSSASNSKVMQIFVGGSSIFNVATSGITQSAQYGALTNSTNADFCGGTCSGSLSGAQGGGTFQGMDNSSINNAAAGGYAIFRGGMLTAGTPNGAALEGVVQVGEGYLKGTIAAVGDVVCGTATAFTVTDCPHGTTTNIIGIATSISNPIGVVSYGLAPVKLDNSATIGDNVCMSTLASHDGQGHDNASTACPLGQAIGVIVANTGTIIVMAGSGTNSVTLGTGIPLVQLHISQ